MGRCYRVEIHGGGEEWRKGYRREDALYDEVGETENGQERAAPRRSSAGSSTDGLTRDAITNFKNEMTKMQALSKKNQELAQKIISHISGELLLLDGSVKQNKLQDDQRKLSKHRNWHCASQTTT